MRKFKNKIKFFLIVSLLVIPGISVFAAEDLPENLKPLAEKLGCSTKEECANVFEKNFDQNIQFADSLGVYDGDKTKKDIVNSYKEEVINKLSGVGSPEELEERIVELAKGLVKSKPQLAKKFDIGENQIKAVENAVSKAKEIGVSFSQCQKMDPESAPVQLLRGCAKLAKEKVVQSYIPEKDREKADMAEKMADLQEALDSGKYQCGNGTAEGCGNFCLNPDAEVRKSGIPEVCKQIAKDFFGNEGEAELERAYSQVGQVAQFYNTKAKNVTFKTSDGKTLYDPKAIGQHMQELAAKGDVENLEKGMDFMIANGFVKPEDKGFVLDMVKGVKESGRQGFDINECAKNPAGCQEFVPEHIRSRFDSGRKVEEIMKAEFAKQGLGGNPGECEDPTKGELCLKASKSALSQLESLASESPEVKFIVNEIKQRIEFGEKGVEARRRAEEEFRSAGNKITIGDREFTDFSQVNEFCKFNGQLCLAEGAKRGFVEKDFAVEKYQHSFNESERFGGYSEFPQGDFGGQMPFGFPGPSDFSGQSPQGQPFQGGFPGPSGQFPGQGQTQGQFPGGQNFSPQGFSGQFKIDKQKALADFQKWLDNPEGAPPVPMFGGQGQGGFPGGPQGQPFQGGFPGPSGQFPGQGQTQGQFPGGQNFSPGQFGRPQEGQRDFQNQQKPPEFPPYQGDFRGPGGPEGQFPGEQQNLNFERSQDQQGFFGNFKDRIFGDDQYKNDQSRMGPPMPNPDFKVEPPFDGNFNFVCPAVMPRVCSPGEQPVKQNDRCMPYSCEQRSINEPSTKLPVPSDDKTSLYKGGVFVSCMEKGGVAGTNALKTIHGWIDSGMLRYQFPWGNLTGDGANVVPPCEREAGIVSDNYNNTQTTSTTNTAVKETTSAPEPVFDGYSTNPGTSTQCPGFAFQKWNDSTGKPYCQLYTKTSCSLSYPDWLDKEKYQETNCLGYKAPTINTTTNTTNTGSQTSVAQTCPSGQWWDGATRTCTSSSSCGQNMWWDPARQSCRSSSETSSGYTGYSMPSNQRQQSWNSLGLSSMVRADADASRIEKLKQSCANVSSGSNIWMPGAGNYESQDFGMPDPAKCAIAATCTSGQYFNGSSCSSSGGYNNYTVGGSGSGGSYAGDANSCPGFSYSSYDSSGKRYCRLNDGSACSLTYPEYLNQSNYRSDLCPAMTSGGTTGGGYTGGTMPSCSSGQWWDSSTQTCKSSTSGTYYSDPATGCAQAGGTWNSSSNYCQMPSSSTYSGSSSYPSSSTSTSCGSGMWWDSSTQSCKPTTPSDTPPPTSSIDTTRFISGIYGFLNIFTDLLSGR